jgi:dephospho-CoA kinase
MLRVGLTGGIACGKSHVLARLAAHGFHTLDLDRIAHEVTAPGGAAFDDVVREFGREVLAPGGGLNRKALGALVFADPTARARLNAVVHPRVRDEEARRAAVWRQDPSAVVVSDAALLVETGMHLRFDRLIVVHCRPEQQLQRLKARDGIDEGAARARIDAQMPLRDKRRYAHFEIDTAGSLEDTARQTDETALRLAALAGDRPGRRPASLERALGALLYGPPRGPRGLTPSLVVEEIAAASGLELARLAGKLEPPSAGAWYEAARLDESGPAPETLAAPIVLWSLHRATPDSDFVFAAAASLARLTHRAPAAIASACLQARALLEVAVEGGVPSDLPGRASAWSGEAERWGGARPGPHLDRVFESAARNPGDVEHARRDCPGAGADLAGALVGFALGAASGRASPALVDALGRLASDSPV